MANPACIAIGINQYQFLQPLSYAKADAQALRLFLVEQAGWSPSSCVLLTETSPPVGSRSTNPNRENIINWVDGFLREQVQSGDVLWFFFSGYGVNIQGEDYLMPQEGNPNDISTGISVRWLFERLQQRGDGPVLVLLDINRSQGVQPDGTVGQQTVELAKNLGIPTVLSGQLDEFSHEAAELGQGLFTAGLLEVLRYAPEMTLAGLERYLRDRLPELSQHYDLPVQTPLSAIPSPEAANQLIWLNAQRGQSSGEILDAGLLPDTSGRPNPQTAKSDNIQIPLTPAGDQTDPKQAAVVAVTDTNGKSTPANDQMTWWQNLLFWGSGVALVALMIAGVVLRNRDAFIGETSSNAIGLGSAASSQQSTQNSKLRAGNPSANRQNAKLSKPSQSQPQTSQEVLDKARTLIVPNQASQFSQAIAQASKIPQGDPLYKEAQEDIARWSAVILDLAKGRAQQGDFSGAIAAAQLVPSDQPVYAQSQQDLARWKEPARQQQANQDLLQAAKGLIDPAQASSYNKAITAASKVPPGQPGYAEAQKLTAQWSRAIYQLAVSRAAKGKYQEAIQTVALVPENTPDYQAARKAIDVWKVKSKQ